MKKIASLFTIALIYGFSASCGPNPNTGANPSPTATAKPVITPSPSPTPTPIPTATPTPVPTPVPTPTPNPIPLEQQIFQIEINLEDAIVPFVNIDGEGPIGLPITVNLKGGHHEFIIGDVSTSCRINLAPTIDKDHTKFIYKSGVDCSTGRE